MSPPRVRVQLVTPTHLTWPFDNNASPQHVYGMNGAAESVDSFPCYAHDVIEVTRTLEACVHRFSPLSPLFVHVAQVEGVSRTNGWAAKDHDWSERPDGDTTPKWAAHIWLSGKRIPPHPAVTRYVVAHEYGHHVQAWMEHEQGLPDEALLDDYATMRGLPDSPRYGGGHWHDQISEVFANDWRILALGIEVEYWPHPGIDRPELSSAVEWWADALRPVIEVAA